MRRDESGRRTRRTFENIGKSEVLSLRTAILKTAEGAALRGFESHPLRTVLAFSRVQRSKKLTSTTLYSHAYSNRTGTKRDESARSGGEVLRSGPRRAIFHALPEAEER